MIMDLKWDETVTVCKSHMKRTTMQCVCVCLWWIGELKKSKTRGVFWHR